ncbi:family 43 glycosylhydrolase [Marinilabilia rubra]|uniref:Glycosyl hydrolase family 43 n=1 Tax=Marinilabilia rubra TaxID=2162893 RepID=A0A2U2B640_9BACT|nr:family 43 glycosylhydrolase [Marinilabilia rubra]PWD98516.1 hypothetical protein DDZ16_14855 [Marinilabilia rubra]
MRKFHVVCAIFMVFFQNISAQEVCPVPLYTDPNFKGAADAEVIYSQENNEWMFFYTSRRSVCKGGPLPALAIGVAASKDFINWEHRGYIKVDGIGGEPTGPDIMWAPGIVRDRDTFHMFLTFKKGDGGGSRWGIPESIILHLTTTPDNLIDGWTTRGIMHVPFSSIDASIVKHKDTWNIFHRDITPGKKGVNTYRVTTDDLDSKCNTWNYLGAVPGDPNDKSVHGFNYQEAQYVFFWKGYYWLLTDPTASFLTAYRAKDLEEWEYVGPLFEEKNGHHKTQKGWPRHPSVAVMGDRAFLFYFNQPYRKIDNHPESETCFVQVAELKYEDGKIWFDRNAKVIPPENLKPVDGNWGFIGKQ